MAEAMEGRYRKRNGGGSLREHSHHVREDMASLQKDLSKLTSDIGALAQTQWQALGERMNGGVTYVSDQVRTRPLAALGIAAGVGVLAGLLLANGRRPKLH